MHPLLTFLDQANLLKRLPRTGWLLAGVQPCESVADHTCATALLALGMAATINAEPAAHGLAQPLNTSRVVTLALLHDLAEAVLTDLPKRSSALLGAAVKHAAEAGAMAELTANLPGGGDLLALWREYDAASSPEARLVRDADKLEMVHQALQYAQRGQRNLAEFWEGHRWHYEISATLFACLQSSRT